MSQFFDYDPYNKITHYFDFDEETNNSIITSVCDVEPLLNVTKAIRNDGLTDKGIKEGWWLYAKVPAIVIMQMRQKGIDFYNKDHEKRVLEEINTNYPYLKVTEKNLGGKAKLIV